MKNKTIDNIERGGGESDSSGAAAAEKQHNQNQPFMKNIRSEKSVPPRAPNRSPRVAAARFTTGGRRNQSKKYEKLDIITCRRAESDRLTISGPFNSVAALSVSPLYRLQVPPRVSLHGGGEVTFLTDNTKTRAPSRVSAPTKQNQLQST